MTSLVYSHRFVMARNMLSTACTNMVPASTYFRDKEYWPEGYTRILPANTHYIEYDTDIPSLDKALSYFDAQTEHSEYYASERHKLVGCIAGHIIASHGWSETTRDAITIVWLAVIGMAAYQIRWHQVPKNKLAFYSKGLGEPYTMLDCITWKEFLNGNDTTGLE